MTLLTRKPRPHAWLLGLAIAASVPASTTAEFRVVALSGEPTPGGAPGMTFDELFSPVMNVHGQTAFAARLSQNGVANFDGTAVYSEGTGALAEVARSGQQAPGSPGGVTFFAVGDPRINDSGQTAFFGHHVGPGVDVTDSDYGYYIAANGSLTKAVRTGDSAPGGLSGSTLEVGRDYVFNNTGELVFRAGLQADEPIPFPFNQGGVYRAMGGGLKKVAASGDPVPGSSSGEYLRRFEEFVVSPTGVAAFVATVDDAQDINFGVFTESGGEIDEVVRSGEPVPSAEPGVVFEDFVHPNGRLSMDGADNVVFDSLLPGLSLDIGVYSQGSSGLRKIIRTGDPIPDADPELTLFSVNDGPVTNESGMSLIAAGVEGPTAGPFTKDGLYLVDAQGVTKVVRSGDPAPGGGTILANSLFRGAGINAAGQVAFVAAINIDDDPSADLGAILATNLAGELVEIIREGDSIDVDPDPMIGDLRTIDSLEFAASASNTDGRGTSFSNQGHLAFLATFTDGSQAILVSDAVAVPEPGGLAAVLLGGLVCGRRGSSLGHR